MHIIYCPVYVRVGIFNSNTLLKCHNILVDKHVSCIFKIIKLEEYDVNKDTNFNRITNESNQHINDNYLWGG